VNEERRGKNRDLARKFLRAGREVGKNPVKKQMEDDIGVEPYACGEKKFPTKKKKRGKERRSKNTHKGGRDSNNM